MVREAFRQKAICWRPPAAGRGAFQLLVGTEGGVWERWRLGGALGGGDRLAQPAVRPAAGELYAMAACAPTAEVYLAADDGSVHCLRA